MAECKVTEKNLLQKVEAMLERKPEAYDVTFCVGREKKQVHGIRLLLKAASPVFEKEFEEKWEIGLIKNGQEGIPFPDFDPEVFQLFIKLTMSDTWNKHVLKKSNLPPNQILNLLSLCRHYQMKNATRKLQEIVSEFLQSFAEFQQTDGFLLLSQVNLKTVIASDDLQMEEMDIFKCTMRWAHTQCSTMKMEATQENLRRVLGSCLNEIRFPLMSINEFTQALENQDILTSDETLKIYKYFGLNSSKNFKTAQLPFKTNSRVINQKQETRSQLSSYKTLSIIESTQLTDGTFSCIGRINSLFFQTSDAITLYGIGFVGPDNVDAFYDVTVELKPYTDFMGFRSKKMKKRIFTKKGKICSFIFDEPIAIEGNAFEGSRIDNAIYYRLSGPEVPYFVRSNDRDLLLEHDGIDFRITRWGNQIAELYFQKI